MNKALPLVIFVFTVLAIILTAPAEAKSKELCEVGSEVTYRIAMMRDKGKTREESKEFLRFTGMKPEYSKPFLDLVYGRGRNFSPEDLKTAFFNFCMSQET